MDHEANGYQITHSPPNLRAVANIIEHTLNYCLTSILYFDSQQAFIYITYSQVSFFARMHSVAASLKVGAWHGGAKGIASAPELSVVS